MSERATFIPTSKYLSISDQYGLVYWNNSLHHMPDCTAAVEWSAERLACNGLFAMDDFIGPSRFQWTERMLDYCNTFRRNLPSEVLAGAKPVTRPTIERMLDVDPSEAADSSSIVPALKSVFPRVDIAFTGGTIYHLALNDILAKIQDESQELKAALMIDDALSLMGENHYAVALSVQ
ncbi:hypothetical protein [Methyloceanibacter stevinii]|uniref:hypothetical protein n=1 Tax=Methyloceanibacter stevinii TaxID=1774970 RepID=UPI00114C94AE|nr:hypothetical protein [Methyloceanibacter stevinii]